MKLDINLEGLAVPVSQTLVNLVNQHLLTYEERPALYSVVINFRDTSYSIETGGYHPVEIGFELTEGKWTISYLTDFALFGGPFPELAKEVDFNLAANTLFMAFGEPTPLNTADAQDFYQLWETNFLSYVEMGSYDQIEVSACD